MKQAFFSQNGPKPIGPYSPVIRAGDFIFVSGQGPVDPETGRLIDGDIYEQTKRTLTNVRIALVSAGCIMGDVAKMNVYLANLSDFNEMNRAYEEFFQKPFPARATIQAGLLGGMLIEIEATAFKPL